MADSIQTMLDHREMTASYRAAPTQVGTPMVDTFFTDVSSTSGDEVVIPVLSRNNSPMPGNTRGSAPRRHAGPGLSKKQFALFNSFNEYALQANCLRFLRSPDPGIQRLGREVIDATIAEAGERQKLFRDVVIGQIMTYGKAYLGSNGEVLVPSVHATTGVVTDPADALTEADYGVSDSHRGRCDQTGGGDYIFSGAWDTTSTNIFEELTKCRDASLKAGAERPDTVWLHELQRSSLITNELFQKWAVYNNVRSEEVLTGRGFENVYGWNFRFMEGYWTDASGTQRPVIPVRQAIIAPSSATWRECKEGEQDVPTTVGVISSIEAGLSSLQSVQGMFSYAQLYVQPAVQLTLCLGDNFGIGFRNSNAIWMPTAFAS